MERLINRSQSAQCGGHRFVEGRYLNAHAVIRAIIQHRHEIAIAADEDDAIYSSSIDDANDIHAEVEVKVALLAPLEKVL